MWSAAAAALLAVRTAWLAPGAGAPQLMQPAHHSEPHPWCTLTSDHSQHPRAGCPPPFSCPAPQDLADSKRINAHVHGVPNDATPLKRRRQQLADIGGLTATVVSQLFWPQLPQEELRLPREVWGRRGGQPGARPARRGCSAGGGVGRHLAAAAAGGCLARLPTRAVLARTPLASRPCTAGACAVADSSLTRCAPPGLTCGVQVQSMLDTYGAKYHSLKVPRKLQWRPHLGQVTLEATVGGQALEFQVRRGGGLGMEGSIWCGGGYGEVGGGLGCTRAMYRGQPCDQPSFESCHPLLKLLRSAACAAPPPPHLRLTSSSPPLLAGLALPRRHPAAL